MPASGSPTIALGTIASLGRVMQMAYVPADIDAALDFWTRTVGAGPFFQFPHIKMDTVRYLGQPTKIDFSAMLGYWGDMQIELLQPHDETPSIYSTWLREGREGLHHVCIVVDDMKHARDVVARSGATIVQDGTLSGGEVEVIYVDTGGGPGTMVEIIRQNAGGLAAFDTIRRASVGWDGSEPVRRFGRR